MYNNLRSHLINNYLSKLILLGFLLLLLLSTSCNNNSTQPLINLNNLSDTAWIDKWQVLGAFSLSQENGLLNDELKRYNLSEQSVTIEQLNALNVDTLSGFSKKLVHLKEYAIDFYKHFRIPDSITSPMVTYAYCIVKSNREQTLMLNYASNSGSVIWLNNKVLLEEKDVIYKRFTYGQKYIPITVHKGKNLLLVKVRNDGKNWKMFAAIEKFTEQGQRRHNILSITDNYGHIMNSCMIENDTIQFGWWMPADYYGDFNIKGKGTDTTFTMKSRPGYLDIAFLKDGFYRLTLRTAKDTIVQHFYKGNFHKAFVSLLGLLKGMELDPITRKCVEAYAYRYNHIMKPANLPKMDYEIPDWKRKLMFLYKGLNAIYENHINKACTSIPNINAYVSNIDGAVQYYQLFAPNDYQKNKPLPLIVQLPVPVKRFNTYLETHHFADIVGNDLWSYAANKYNVIILKANFRMVDVTNGNAIDEYDLWENIAAIKKQYNIDTTRISLMGSCEAAFYSLRIGTQYPERIAAMALVSPRLATIKGEDTPWLQQQNPLNLLKNSWNIPTLNIHSRLDEHTKVINSHYLNALIDKEKFTNYVYRELPLDFEPYYIDEYIEDLVEFNLKHSLTERKLDEVRFTAYQLKNSSYYWFTVTEMEQMGQKLTVQAQIKDNRLTVETENVKRFKLKPGTLPYNPKKKLVIVHNNKKVYEDYATGKELTIGANNETYQGLMKNSRIEGPFAHAFLQPFIIVPGTMGDPNEIELNHTIANQLVEMWDSMYYTKCRVMTDKSITEKEIQHCNLILIGNEHNNALLKQYSASLPLRNTSNSVVMNKETYQGKNLNYYMVYPNPAQADKYIAILGYNNPSSFLLISESETSSPLQNISHFGFYDYKVWTAEEVMGKGYFGGKWK
ncbi:MAG TPA: hypothetical protein VHO72_00960 [Bacteroidales bacterium]|nr:hypothetical protein [Bacteroidales bacterium]